MPDTAPALGISTLVDLHVPLPELAGMVATAGFSHLSLCHDVQHSAWHLPSARRGLRQALAAAGLKLNYLHAPIQPYYDLTSPDPQVRALTLAMLKLSLTAATELDGRGVVTHVMNGPAGDSAEAAGRVAAGIAALEAALEQADALGVALYCENLPLNLDCGRIGLSVLRACAHPSLRICLDTCHARIDNPDYLALVRELAPRVGATHLSDTRGAHDSHLLPGEGVVDFAAVGAALGRASYRGVVDLECSLWMLRKRQDSGKPHPGDPPLRDTAAYLAEAYAAATRITAAIAANM